MFIIQPDKKKKFIFHDMCESTDKSFPTVTYFDECNMFIKITFPVY